MKVSLWKTFGWFLVTLSLGPIMFGCYSSREITSLNEADGNDVVVRAKGDRTYRLYSYEADSTSGSISGKGTLQVGPGRYPFEGSIQGRQILRIEVEKYDPNDTFLLFLGVSFGVAIVSLLTTGFMPDFRL